MKICPRCGKDFRQKSNLINHLNRKTICDAKYLDIKKDEIINNYDNYIKEYEKIKNNIKNIFDSNTDIAKEVIKLGLEVENIKLNNQEREKELNNKINQLQKELNSLSSTNKKKSKKIYPNIQINNINNLGTYVENNTTNLLNYNDDSNRILNEKINKKEWFRISNKKIHQSIPLLIKKKHIEFEEGRNIYIPDLKSNYGWVYQDNEWKATHLEKFFENLIVNNYNDIYDFVNENKNSFTNFNKIDKMFAEFDEDRHGKAVIENNIKRNIKIDLHNNRKSVKYKNNSKKRLK